MKKNYSEPKVKVQTIALQSMIALSSGEGEEGGGQDANDRSDLLDDWSL